MANVLAHAEDIVNAALGRIGYKLRIGNLYDGTDAANLALDIYAQTRDFVLRVADWDFAQEVAAAVPLGPSVVPWAYSYAYPPDCVRLRDMFGPTYLADKNNPLPNLWTRDTSLIGGVPTEVVLCNIAGATFVYTQRVTNPVLWDSGFAETMIAALAERLAASLANLDVVKVAAEEAKADLAATGDLVG